MIVLDCEEVVTWVVFRRALPIARVQVSTIVIKRIWLISSLDSVNYHYWTIIYKHCHVLVKCIRPLVPKQLQRSPSCQSIWTSSSILASWKIRNYSATLKTHLCLSNDLFKTQQNSFSIGYLSKIYLNINKVKLTLM